MYVVVVDTTLTTPPLGGPHVFLVRLSSVLLERSFRVSVITQPGKDTALVDQLRRQGASVSMDMWRTTHLPEERAARLAEWVNSQRPDAYIISTSPDAGWLALPLLDRTVATMAIAHANVEAYYAPLRHYGEFIDRAVGVSRQITEEIIRAGQIPANRATHVPYGVPTISRNQLESDWERKSADSKRLRIVYLGRIVQSQKRALDLAPLAVELSHRHIDFELNLIGDGQELPTLLAMLDRSGLSNRVRSWGWLDPDVVRQRLRDLDVIVLPSDSEGLPIALLEGMGHGLVPVVSEIRSGITEVVRDGKSGYFAPVGNTSAFADRLQALAENRTRLRAMSGLAWETSQEYSIERMAQNYISCFRQMKETRWAQGPRITTPTDFRVMPSCKSRYPYWLRKIRQQVLALKGGFVSHNSY